MHLMSEDEGMEARKSTTKSGGDEWHEKCVMFA